MDASKLITHLLQDDGEIPNNPRFPLLVYPGVVSGESAEGIRSRFHQNGWQGTWVATVYTYHHYHSTAHEVLGCFQGSATIQFGGESGPKVDVKAGDGVLIPAGVGHKRITSSSDFLVVGGYPPGQEVDMCDGTEATRERILASIASLGVPETDPFTGKGGPATQWLKIPA